MPIKSISLFVNEHDTRLWRIIHHYVGKARKGADYSKVKNVGFDETSSRRGHNYVSIFVDTDGPNILFATEGKGASTIKRFKEDLIKHGGAEENIKEMCCDMSPSFIKGVEWYFPNAKITFDKFHIMKIINEAVDKVRKEEQKKYPELIRTRFLWLQNPQNLSKKQSDKLNKLTVKKLNLKTIKAYHIKLNFQEIFKHTLEESEILLKKWFFWATHSRILPIIRAAYVIKLHWEGILQWFKSKMTNGILEGLNSLIQAAKAKARGYRTNKNLIAIIYLIGGKFNYGLST
jgi:transposase